MRRVETVAATRRARRIRLALLTALCGAVGCGEATGLGAAGVDGTWQYYVSTFVGREHVCVPDDSSFAVLQLRQETATTFGGSYEATGFECQSPSGNVSTGAVGPGEIFDGRLHGSDITFRLTITSLTSTGTISSGRMSGTATLTVNRDNVLDTLEGTWRAERLTVPVAAFREID